MKSDPVIFVLMRERTSRVNRAREELNKAIKSAQDAGLTITLLKGKKAGEMINLQVRDENEYDN
jgi:hypothetical protein